MVGVGESRAQLEKIAAIMLAKVEEDGGGGEGGRGKEGDCHRC